jgi:16S rRNA (guanine527-N7)-methyltransferase
VKHSATIASGISVAVESRLRAFESLLLRWNARINLVSRDDAQDLWTRHILDSVQLAPLLPPAADTLVDLGSGAGFPGLVLAIVTGRLAHLVEADQRKAAFLREAIRETAANAVVHAARAETLELPSAPVVTARALAPLAALLPLARHFLTDDGACLFPKGRTCEDELTAAANEWHMRVERFPSETGPGATILRISEIRRVGPET